jgi:hypothetical protein
LSPVTSPTGSSLPGEFPVNDLEALFVFIDLNWEGIAQRHIDGLHHKLPAQLQLSFSSVWDYI